MSSDASWPLYRSCVQYLKQSNNLKRNLGPDFRVYDPCEPIDSLPALIWMATMTSNWHSATFDGQKHEFSLVLRVPIKGASAAREIASVIINHLHNADFDVPGHALVDLQFEESQSRFMEAQNHYETLFCFSALTVSD